MPDRPERVLIFAPAGRDTQVAQSVLEASGTETSACYSLPALLAEIEQGVGAVIVTDEAIAQANVQPLASWLRGQPPWADLPFIVLTRQGGSIERNPAAERLTSALANVSLLERPFHATTLVSVVRSALRARRRQYMARDALDERDRLLAELSDERGALEQRVAERTADLAAANIVLQREIEAKNRAENQLRQSQKLETMGQLVGGVAHDFNNLLMVILSSLELLRRRTGNDPLTLRLLDSARRGAERGSVLTKRLLAFARKQDLEPERTDLVELAAGMTDLLHRSVGPQIEIEVRHESEVPAVIVDRIQLEMALLNLVVNARDALAGTGRIAIVIRREPDVGAAEAPLAAGDYVSIGVEDSGPGMDAETLRQAVEPFFSTKGVGQGTGLGLSMVHGMARQSGGAFVLRSQPGQGTTASIWLPSAEHVAIPAPAVPSAPVQAPARTGTILMVDDDELVAASTAAMLEDLGYAVVTRHSAREALEVLGSGTVPDLLLTDQAMPVMTGVELAAQVRRLRPGLPILLATGYAELSGSDLQGMAKLTKPFSQAELARELNRLLLSA